MFARILVETVTNYLRLCIEDGSLRTIKDKTIYTLPEGLVPPTMGERAICIYPRSLNEIPVTQSDTRKRRILFSIDLIQRVRSTPSDKMDKIAYLSAGCMSDTIEAIEVLIESPALLQMFRSRILDQENPLLGVSDTFVMTGLSLEPAPLYASFFRNNKDEPDHSDKIAGYRMSSTFLSPVVHESISACLEYLKPRTEHQIYD